MSPPLLEIDFGILGIGVRSSSNGKVSFETHEIAAELQLPENASKTLIRRRLSRMNNEEQLSFHRHLLARARRRK